jgi:hypothetical protein
MDEYIKATFKGC